MNPLSFTPTSLHLNFCFLNLLTKVKAKIVGKASLWDKLTFIIQKYSES